MHTVSDGNISLFVIDALLICVYLGDGMKKQKHDYLRSRRVVVVIQCAK